MAFYREIEGDITRDYKLRYGIESIETTKARLDIVPTKSFDLMVFLDGELQFAKKDEYIYHEMLVHPAMSCCVNAKRVCILGGGDGCAAREVLKWNSVSTIDLYDYDKNLVNLFTYEYSHMNSKSLQSTKVQTHIRNVVDIPCDRVYDVLLVDLVDPKYEESSCRAVWTELLKKLPTILHPDGSLVINAGGIRPWDIENVEWLLFLLTQHFRDNTTHTLEAYKVFVPSFASEWCFLLIRPIDSYFRFSMFQDNTNFQYFDETTWSLATKWPKDTISRIPIERVKLNGYLPPV